MLNKLFGLNNPSSPEESTHQPPSHDVSTVDSSNKTLPNSTNNTKNLTQNPNPHITTSGNAENNISSTTFDNSGYSKNSNVLNNNTTPTIPTSFNITVPTPSTPLNNSYRINKNLGSFNSKHLPIRTPVQSHQSVYQTNKINNHQTINKHQIPKTGNLLKIIIILI
eukprot:UN02589